MFSLSFVITNPFNDRMGVITQWHGKTSFLKFWEVTFSKSSDIFGLLFHIRNQKDLSDSGFFVCFALLGYEIIFDFYFHDNR